MKRLFIVLTLIFLFSTLVFADSVEVKVSPKKIDVFSGENVEYLVHVENKGNEDIALTIKSIDLNWILKQDFEKFVIEKRSSRDIDVIYEPLGKLSPRSYGINLIIWNDDMRIEKILPVNVINYEGLIGVDFKSLPSVDPRKGTLIKLGLTNKYNLDLKELKVNIFTESFEKIETVDLSPKGFEELEFPLELHPQQLEGDYPIRVKVLWGNELLYDNFFDLNIAGFTNIKEVVNFKDSFLASSVSVERTNEGNAVEMKDLVVEFTLLEKMFSSFETEPSKIEKVEGKYKLSWEQKISPGESFVLNYDTNYRRPLLIFLLVVVLVVVGYFLLRRSLKIRKKVVVVKKGDATILRVTLLLYNGGKFSIKLLTLVDRVPSAIKAPTLFGSVGPKKVGKIGDNVSLVWNIPVIAKGEELVYSYTIPVKLHKDGMILPSAYVRYSERGKRIMNASNTVSIGR
ncbi:hypothetical protein J4459_03645 [Candidatus Woesearchaeota archaeon]|nr:hypothetical protein [Candidatus Woesearchaeota archaeon]